MQEQRELIHESFGGMGILNDDGLAELGQNGLLLPAQLFTGVDDNGDAFARLVRSNLLQQLGPFDIGETKIDDNTLESRFGERGQRLMASLDSGNAHLTLLDELGHRIELREVVLDDENIFRSPIDEAKQIVQRRLQRFFGDRLLQLGDEPARGHMRLALLTRYNVYWNGGHRRIGAQSFDQLPPVHVRQPNVNRHGVGAVFLCELERRRAIPSNDCLEAALACKVEQDARECRAVFNDQQHSIARLQSGPVVDHLAVTRHYVAQAPVVDNCARQHSEHCAVQGARTINRGVRNARQLNGERMIEGELAAYPDRAFDGNLTAEQSCDLSTD